MEKDNKTLYVDLDGTFTRADMLYETCIALLIQNPLYLFMLPVWLFSGIANLKAQIADRVSLDFSNLPLNPELQALLVKRQADGWNIILATASNEKIAQGIVKAHPVFNDYIASDNDTNLKSRAKLNKMTALTPEFSYCGNSSDDLVIFPHAAESILVNPPSKKIIKKASPLIQHSLDLPAGKTMKTWIKQLRVYQWIKNILVVVPLVLSQSYYDITSVSLVITAFFCFSMLASATYIFNDLLDLESDRNHPRKKFRPLAHGDISILSATIVASIIGIGSLTTAFFISTSFFIVLCGYLFLTLFYSVKLKRFMGLDMVTLAGLYTIRVIAGAAIIDVVMSYWLLSFSMFIFFSLALVKRCAELRMLEVKGKEKASGRDYSVDDYPVFMAFGASSSMMAVLMFAFYINSDVLENQYQTPEGLWLILPALVYWLLRVWVKTHRGEMTDDPILFAFKDRGSLILGIITGLIIITAQIL